MRSSQLRAQMITYVGKISVMHGPSYLLGVPSFFPVVVIAVAVTRVRFLGVVRAIIVVVVVAAAHSRALCPSTTR